MNNCIFILKINEEPGEENYNKTIQLLEVKAGFTYNKKNKLYFENINLLIWGNQIDNILKYYRKNDYVVVEGFLTTYLDSNINVLKKKKKLRLQF